MYDPSCVTTWTPLYSLEKWQIVSFTVLTCATCIATFILNATLILSLYKTKQLSNAFNILIIFHGVVECCYAGNRQILTALQWLMIDRGCKVELIIQFFAFFFPDRWIDSFSNGSNENDSYRIFE